ncbi:MAG: hypothetical protein IKN54_06600, partial [Lachnospiraceae bacterium]|nr:hypothetical protein [Lachnospiraceae bacterium]
RIQDANPGMIVNACELGAYVWTVCNRKPLDTGNVEVTKVFDGITSSDIPAGFKITNNYNTDEFTVSNATSGNGTAANPYKWVIENVPVGTKVKFTESGYAKDGYTVTINSKEATASNAEVESAEVTKTAAVTVEYVNAYTQKKGNVEVTKVFDGITGTDIPSTFKITNDYNTDEFTVSNATSGSGTAREPYKWVIENVPVGTKVTFTESGYEKDNYTVLINTKTASAENAKVETAEVNETTPVTAEYVNKYTQKKGSVEVTKSFSGISALPDTFKITNDFNDTVFTVSNATSGSGTSADPYKWTISEVPIGTTVKFTETGYEKDGYIVVANGLLATATSDVSKTAVAAEPVALAATFTNVYTQKIGKVEVTKVFDGVTGTDIPSGFKITNDYNTDEFTVSNATSGSGTTADPYKWVIENVPVGTKVKFTESGYAKDGYTVTINSKEATAANAEIESAEVNETSAVTVEYVNAYTQKVGNVEVTKVFDGISGTDIPATFKITNDYNTDEFTVTNATSGSGTSASPYKWVIENVPVGTKVKFT